MLWNSIGSMFRLVCNYAITIAVVRLSSGFDAAGALALSMSIANLINPFADFRLRTLQVTDVREERTSGEYIGLRLFTSVLAFSIGLVYSFITTSSQSLLVVALYLVYSLITNFIEVFHAIDQRHMRMDYSGQSYILQGLSNLLAFSAILWWTNSLIWAVIGLGVTTTAVLLLFDIPRTSRLERLSMSISAPAIASLTKLLPLVFAQVAASAVLTIPKQYLEAQLGSEALGIYSSVASPALIVQMGATYVYSPLMGEFAEKLAHDKRSALVLLRRTVLAILGVTAAASLLLVIIGRPLLVFLFGTGISEHVGLMQPALLCTAITAFAWFMNDLLLAARDFGASFLGNIVASIVTFLGSQSFITRFGMNGVSWIGVLAYSTSVALLGLLFWRDYRRLPRRGEAIAED